MSNGSPVRAAYLVSRFPIVTETFVLRELNEVDRFPDLELELVSLFKAQDPVMHAGAERWSTRVRQASLFRGAREFMRGALRHPMRARSVVAELVQRHGSAPRQLG